MTVDMIQILKGDYLQTGKPGSIALEWENVTDFASLQNNCISQEIV